MKTLLFIFGSTTMLSLSNPKVEFPGGDIGAVVSIQSDIYDFGEIKKGDNGTFVYSLKNDGFEPLIISKCDKTCGCTIPKCNHDPILPGETTEVEVTYDTNRL